jgi:hypothetical protein
MRAWRDAVAAVKWRAFTYQPPAVKTVELIAER